MDAVGPRELRQNASDLAAVLGSVARDHWRRYDEVGDVLRAWSDGDWAADR